MIQELNELEQSAKYLFHGSASPDIKILEPRQPMSFMKPDGVPAVCASEQVEPPIFMAVLGSRRLGGWGLKDAKGFGFYITKSHWEKANEEGWIGYIYLLNRQGFIHHSGWEWRSQEAVKPIRVIKVGIKDLPADIMIIPDNDYYKITRGRA